MPTGDFGLKAWQIIEEHGRGIRHASYRGGSQAACWCAVGMTQAKDRSIREKTLMTVSADLPLAVKYDLYMIDRRRDSVLNDLQLRAHARDQRIQVSGRTRLREFAIGHPRVVPELQFTCE